VEGVTPATSAPVPAGPWLSRQTWHDVLFAHWPIAASALRPLVPAALDIETFDGSSWVSLVPFRMTGVTARFVPPIPGLSAFPETNLRVYVRHGDRPGVWFISLDASNALAVWAARRFFHLPYFRAAMQLDYEGERVHYRTERIGGVRATFVGAYWPVGSVFAADPGTLDHFLTERYRLYARASGGDLLALDIHHPPWPLQRAQADIEMNTVATSQGVAVGGEPLFLHYARRLDVRFWPLRVAERGVPPR
jgi:uncharacterized protein YqjF (DUF2071 family)